MTSCKFEFYDFIILVPENSCLRRLRVFPLLTVGHWKFVTKLFRIV